MVHPLLHYHFNHSEIGHSSGDNMENQRFLWHQWQRWFLNIWIVCINKMFLICSL